MAGQQIGEARVVVTADAGGFASSAEKQMSKGLSKLGGDLGKFVNQSMQNTMVAGAATIGTLAGKALNKGFARVEGLDQAKGRMAGLGIEGKNLEKVMDQVSGAVDGTTASLSDGATAASLMMSSGIKMGPQLEKSLDAIVGLTEATGANMDEITPIMQKVAANSSNMGEALAQLGTRGVNGMKMLADNAGVTEAEMAKMVKAGEVSFDEFTAAISKGTEKMGGAMASTFSGLRANINSAFGRIGAVVQGPILEASKTVMGSVLPAMKDLANGLTPLTEVISAKLNPGAEKLAELIDRIDFTKLDFTNLPGISYLKDNLPALLPVIGALAGSFGPLLTQLPIVGQLFTGLTGPVGAVVGVVAAMFTQSEALRAAFKGIFDSGGQLIGVLGPIAEALSSAFAPIAGAMGDALAALITAILPTLLTLLQQSIPLIEAVAGMFAQLAPILPTIVQAGLDPLLMALSALLPIFSGAVNGLAEFINWLTSGISSMGPFKDILISLGLGVGGVVLAFKAWTVAGNTLKAAMAVWKVAQAAWIAQSYGAAGASYAVTTATNAQAIAAKVAAGAQKLLNLAMKANPIGIIITAITALVGALVWFFTQTDAGKEIWSNFMNFLKEAWANISKFFQDVWNNVLKPVFEGIGEVLNFVWTSIIKPVFDGISAAAKWVFETILIPLFKALEVQFAIMGGILQGIWEFILKPVFDAIGAVFKWLWETVISVVIDAIKLNIKIMGAVFTWLWNNAIKPAIDAIAAAWNWIYNNVIKPVATYIDASIKAVGAIFDWLWKNAIKPALDAIGAAWNWIYTNIIMPQAQAIMAIIDAVGKVFDWLWVNAVKPAFDAIGTAMDVVKKVIDTQWNAVKKVFTDVWEKGIKPIVDTLVKVITSDPKKAFEAARDAIGKAWEGIQELAKKPVKFVINTVVNGLIDTINGIPGVDLPRVKLPAGFSHGGILPGMSSMGQGDDQLIQARRGEGIMVSEALRSSADRAAFLAVNANGRKGVGFAQQLAGFAKGGLVNPLPKGSYSVSQPWHGGHNGIDLAAPSGTHVMAAAAGTVGLASSVPMGGNEIYVQHDNGLGTRYSHLSAILVKVGQMVSQAEHIGNVGSTGMSTGPHLHYMVHNPGNGSYGNHVDPAAYMGIYGDEKAGGFNILAGLMDWAVGKFSEAFPEATMFVQAAGGLMKQGVEQVVNWGKSLLGTDTSEGDSGRTGTRSIVPNLYDSGGILGTGLNVSMNKTGKPEAVLTNAQWAMIAQLANGIAAGSLGNSKIGQNIADGLAKGLVSGTGVVGGAMRTVSDALVNSFKSDLEIHSPSKVFERLGKYIGEGLIEGISGTVAGTKSALKRLLDNVRGSFSKLREERAKLVKDQAGLWERAGEIDWSKNWDAAMKKAVKLDKQIKENQAAIAAIDKSIGTGKASKAKENALVASISKNNAKLQAITEDRVLVGKKLAQAQSALEKAEDARVGWVAEIQSGIAGRASIISRSSVSGMTEVLTARINETKNFQKKIEQLRKLGLDAATLGELTEEFASTGSTRAADALINGGKPGVKAVMDLRKQLDAESKKLGTNVGQSLYKAGVDAARGLIEGLEKQQAALERAGKKIADAITNQVKKTLKIKSPSKVMAELGAFAGQGVEVGVMKSIRGVENAGGTLSGALQEAMNLQGAAAGFGGPIKLGDTRGTSSGPGNMLGLSRAEIELLKEIIKSGGQRNINIEAGAILVQSLGDPAEVATEVLNALAEELEE